MGVPGFGEGDGDHRLDTGGSEGGVLDAAVEALFAIVVGEGDSKLGGADVLEAGEGFLGAGGVALAAKDASEAEDGRSVMWVQLEGPAIGGGGGW